MNQDIREIQKAHNENGRTTLNSCKKTLKSFVDDYYEDEYDLIDYVLTFENVYKLNLEKYEKKSSGAVLRDIVEFKELKDFMVNMLKEIYGEKEVNRRRSIR